MGRSSTLAKAAFTAVVLLLWSGSASAQWEDPESGFTEPAPAPAPAPAAAPQQDRATTTYGGGSSTRLGFQARLDALNMIASGLGVGNDFAPVPPVTAGVRLLDGALFGGVGLGFFSADGDVRGFSISPLATFDLLTDDWGALYLAGWLNFGRTTVDFPGPFGPGNTFVWGMNLGLGVRGRINEALAIGTEWGWGFSHWVPRDAGNFFNNGFFGTLMFEATVGI